MVRSGIIVLAAGLFACVPYPGAVPEQRLAPITSGPFARLDPGASELESLHFKVYAYGSDNARRVSEIAEADYNSIMQDTNLYSFRPRGLYEVVVYGTADEYRKKTGQPQWSSGVSVGNAIYTYLGDQLPGILAHEMTHLIFFEYMGRARPEQRWINEGLAVYEELRASGRKPEQAFSTVLGNLHRQPLSLEQLIILVPATERAATVSLWYAQSVSLVSFIIEKGGRLGFSQFLAALRDDKNIDQAVAGSFSAGWRSLADLDADWRRRL